MTTNNGTFNVKNGNLSVFDTNNTSRIQLTNTGTLNIKNNIGNNVVSLTPTGIDARQTKIVNVGDPNADNDAANKLYVDNSVSTLAASVGVGLKVRDPVVAKLPDADASDWLTNPQYTLTSNTITSSTPFGDIDNVVVNINDRVLIANKDPSIYWGVYTKTSATVLTRTDLDYAVNNYVLIVNGSLHGNQGYILTSIVSGALDWTLFSNGGGVLDHNELNNLTIGDDHTQYALLAGRGTGQTLIGGSNTGNNLILRPNSANTTTGSVVINSTTASTSSTTGALTVAGGVGVGGAVSVGDTTISSSSTTGALTVAGGVGIAQNLRVGSSIIANSASIAANINCVELTTTDAFVSGYIFGTNNGTDVYLLPQGAGSVVVESGRIRAEGGPNEDLLLSAKGTGEVVIDGGLLKAGGAGADVNLVLNAKGTGRIITSDVDVIGTLRGGDNDNELLNIQASRTVADGAVKILTQTEATDLSGGGAALHVEGGAVVKKNLIVNGTINSGSENLRLNSHGDIILGLPSQLRVPPVKVVATPNDFGEVYSGAPNYTLTITGGLPTIDGINSFNINDRILYSDINSSVGSGIYFIEQLTPNAILRRSDDFTIGVLIPIFSHVLVTQGNNNANKTYFLNNSAVNGPDSQFWVQFDTQGISIKNVKQPLDNADAVNKFYVDNKIYTLSGEVDGNLNSTVIDSTALFNKQLPTITASTGAIATGDTMVAAFSKAASKIDTITTSGLGLSVSGTDNTRALTINSSVFENMGTSIAGTTINLGQSGKTVSVGGDFITPLTNTTTLGNTSTTTLRTGNVTLEGNISTVSGDINLNPNLGNINASSKRIMNLATPTDGSDAVNKTYADAIAQGFGPKVAVRAKLLLVNISSPTASGTKVGKTLTNGANGVAIFDGVTMSLNDRVLYGFASPASPEYGIYTVTNLGSAGTPWVLTRADDADDSPTVGEFRTGTYTFITEGATHATQGWALTTYTGSGGIDVQSQVWTQVTQISSSSLPHSNLTGLTTGDDHTQYALLAGRSGGQTLVGSTVSGQDLILRPNSADSTNGSVIIDCTNFNNSITNGALVVKGTLGVGAQINTNSLNVISVFSAHSSGVSINTTLPLTTNINTNTGGLLYLGGNTNNIYIKSGGTVASGGVYIADAAGITTTNIGTGTTTGNVTIGNSANKVIIESTPTNPTHAATKGYVDTNIESNIYSLVKVCRVMAIPTQLPGGVASGSGVGKYIEASAALPTISGVTLNVGDRILYNSNNADAGIYTVTQTINPWRITRSTNADTNTKLQSGTFVYVLEGNTYTNGLGRTYKLTTPSPFTIDTTNLSFSDELETSENFGTSAISNISIGSTTNNVNIKSSNPAATGGNINIANNAGTTAVNIGTGTTSGTISIGGGTGTQSITIRSGTGDIAINSSDDILIGTTDANRVLIGNGNNTVSINPSAATGLNLNSKKIINLATPTQLTDAATKGYVDTTISSSITPSLLKQPCSAVAVSLTATTAFGAGPGKYLQSNSNGALIASRIDGVTPVLNMRILIASTTPSLNNGIYTITDLGSISTPWILTRATDADTASKLSLGSQVYILQGSTQGKKTYTITNQITSMDVASNNIAIEDISIQGATFIANNTTGSINIGSVDKNLSINSGRGTAVTLISNSSTTGAVFIGGSSNDINIKVIDNINNAGTMTGTINIGNTISGTDVNNTNINIGTSGGGTITIGGGSKTVSVNAAATFNGEITVPTPSLDEHAATKLYVDTALMGTSTASATNFGTTATSTVTVGNVSRTLLIKSNVASSGGDTFLHYATGISGNVGIGGNNPITNISGSTLNLGTNPHGLGGTWKTNIGYPSNGGLATGYITIIGETTISTVSITSSIVPAELNLGATSINHNAGSRNLFIGTGTTSGQINIGSSANTCVIESDIVKIPNIVGDTVTGGTNILIAADGTIGTTVSTRNSKYDINSFIEKYNSTNIINQLEPKTYKFKSNNEESIGLIAEDVYPIIPEIVPVDSNGNPSSIRYDLLSVILLEEIKKQMSKVELLQQQLETQNQQLETQNQQLKTQNQQLETQNQQLETQNQQLETQNQQLETQSQQLETQQFQLNTQQEQINYLLSRLH